MKTLGLAHVWVLMWCCTTAVWSETTSDTHALVTPVTGPWLIVRADGGYQVGLEITPTDRATLDDQSEHPAWIEGEPQRVLTGQAFTRPHGLPGHLLGVHLPVDAPRRAALELADHHLADLILPRTPSEDATVRVLVATAVAWPGPIEIQRFADHLGGPPDLVVALGVGLAGAIGRGGWETDIPIAVIDPGGADPSRDILLAMVGGESALWRTGLTWGPLGLPAVTNDAETWVALDRRLDPWLVVLEAHASWRLEAPTMRSPSARLARACRFQDVPLVVAAGGRPGFISDPWTVTVDDEIVGMPLGTRYCSIPGTTTTAGGMPPLAARLLDGPTLVGLRAEPARLDAALLGIGAPDHHLAWSAIPRPASVPVQAHAAGGIAEALSTWRQLSERTWESGQLATPIQLSRLATARREGQAVRTLLERYRIERRGDRTLDDLVASRFSYPVAGMSAGTGWGLGDARAALETLLASDSEAAAIAAARRALLWLAAADLREVFADRQHLDRAFNQALADGADDFLRRLAAVDPGRIGALVVATDPQPPSLQRQLVLRLLDDATDAEPEAVARLVAATTDPVTVAAIIERSSGSDDDALKALQLLARRVRAMARGDLPLDTDPVLQHRVMAAVFGSPYLSPTPLRPWALSLRETVHDLAKRPIERFLERYGEERPILEPPG